MSVRALAGIRQYTQTDELGEHLIKRLFEKNEIWVRVKLHNQELL